MLKSMPRLAIKGSDCQRWKRETQNSSRKISGSCDEANRVFDTKTLQNSNDVGGQLVFTSTMFEVQNCVQIDTEKHMDRQST